MPQKSKNAADRNRKREKPKKITVLLDPDQSERFEAYCREKGYKKSTLMARLIREHLDSEGFGEHGMGKPNR